MIPAWVILFSSSFPLPITSSSGYSQGAVKKNNHRIRPHYTTALNADAMEGGGAGVEGLSFSPDFSSPSAT